jgi:hypothetical protein
LWRTKDAEENSVIAVARKLLVLWIPETMALKMKKHSGNSGISTTHAVAG